MWGALTLLLLFLVVDPTTCDFITSGIEEARLRLAVETPLSYFLAVILIGSAVISAVIMAWWPKADQERKQLVMRRYLGRAESESDRTPALGPWVRGAVEVARLVLPIRAVMALEVRLRGFAAGTAVRRLPGA